MPSTPRTSTPRKARASAPPAAKPRRRSAPATQPAPAAGPDRAELPREERVRQLAYAYYEERGGADGQAMDDWLRAEQAIEADEVQADRSAREGH